MLVKCADKGHFFDTVESRDCPICKPPFYTLTFSEDGLKRWKALFDHCPVYDELTKTKYTVSLQRIEGSSVIEAYTNATHLPTTPIRLLDEARALLEIATFRYYGGDDAPNGGFEEPSDLARKWLKDYETLINGLQTEHP